MSDIVYDGKNMLGTIRVVADRGRYAPLMDMIIESSATRSRHYLTLNAGEARELAVMLNAAASALSSDQCGGGA